MNSSISIHLWICVLVFLPSCYRCRAQFFFKDGLMINKTDWYLHLKTKEIDHHIQKAVYYMEQLYMHEYYDHSELNMDIGSPEYGLLIESQLSEEHYSLYRHAQTISEVSASITHREYQVYIQYKSH
ncbi:uncharacterized protein LOC107884255 [Acyrthosiphon pisum]|uniref:Uncharacterized protein n=1 Tax=Acyrthosiphon pisum TaxID=7029 RepID=A0A8R2JN40_ACYPI|nr:uncharacterized protein LOC107884255 [Acyrthosiphon pisum]XP_029342387.1 uncharacterized protein LOC107884255 [Acyrthosiphon pisum]